MLTSMSSGFIPGIEALTRNRLFLDYVHRDIPAF
jgi:hypothetical protein